MFLLSPRFFALPLIALAIIMMLPRQPELSAANAAPRTMVVKAVTCVGPNASASCMLADSNNSVVR